MQQIVNRFKSAAGVTIHTLHRNMIQLGQPGLGNLHRGHEFDSRQNLRVWGSAGESADHRNIGVRFKPASMRLPIVLVAHDRPVLRLLLLDLLHLQHSRDVMPQRRVDDTLQGVGGLGTARACTVHLESCSAGGLHKLEQLDIAPIVLDDRAYSVVNDLGNLLLNLTPFPRWLSFVCRHLLKQLGLSQALIHRCDDLLPLAAALLGDRDIVGTQEDTSDTGQREQGGSHRRWVHSAAAIRLRCSQTAVLGAGQ
mmetsp:Transcript_11945/g.29980  ORF Transcript_11945/g.29980 Transcript_11945/m.29980 type:complete len:253 (-) Transcript_11945:150-908(-)